MPIAPITGTLKKKIITDISYGFVLGFALAGIYQFYEHRPLVQKREAYYTQLKKQREAEDSV